MRGVLLLLVVACRHETPGPVIAHASDDVRFVLVGGDATFVRVTKTGLVVERTVKLPARADRVVWVGPDPAVWLERTRGLKGWGFPWEAFGDEPPPAMGPHANALGFVTPAGFAAFPAIAWPPATPPEEFPDLQVAIEEPNASLVATKDAIWEKRCRWYGGPDGGWCSYEYARRYPAPLVFATKDPVEPRAVPWPVVAPSSEITLAREVRLKEPDSTTMEAWENEQHVLACTRAGTKVVYPDNRENDVDERIVWISTSPPVFRVTEHGFYAGVGASPEPEYTIFEGCAPSTRYTQAIAGPDGIVVLFGQELSVRRQDREIGHLDLRGSDVAFAP